MSSPTPIVVRIQEADFDTTAETVRLTKGRSNVGAVVTFTGLCRDEDGRLSALELQHYPGMAEAELTRIANEAVERWPLTGITIVHRHGEIPPGDNIVLTVTASRHREAAFEAASFVMDFLKTRAPFWKKEHPIDGGDGDWVEAKSADDAAADRWRT
ncbi:MAG: molybdenum cofactor biosynthesis protein MoaE [Pseudomonadota bacterium]